MGNLKSYFTKNIKKLGITPIYFRYAQHLTFCDEFYSKFLNEDKMYQIFREIK